ncbi:hypothetical protein HanPI659440_Chr15g0607471 [Helianthus annuus]|nr:hypothetical protein HanPI659440_Chr15g0607471 [Helianthus annuus]
MFVSNGPTLYFFFCVKSTNYIGGKTGLSGNGLELAWIEISHFCRVRNGLVRAGLLCSLLVCPFLQKSSVYILVTMI